MAPNLTFCDIWDEWKVEEGKGRLKKKEGGVGVQAPNSAERSIDVILTP